MSKFRNKKVIIDGITFDSRREAMRYLELRALEKSGEIFDLQRQVKFELIPAVKLDSGRTQRACSYIADFVYRDANGNAVVEDSKGFKTDVYLLKKKLMKWIHGIEIQEV